MTQNQTSLPSGFCPVMPAMSPGQGTAMTFGATRSMRAMWSFIASKEVEGR
eukprot:COSAG01_NODE_2308_length_7944_cov_6.146718_1_plen_51_part_00